MVNCLLNAFAICVGEVSVFSLKVMVLFLGCVGCFVGRSVYCLPKSMCVVFVISVCVNVFPPYVRFVCLYEGCDFIV